MYLSFPESIGKTGNTGKLFRLFRLFQSALEAYIDYIYLYINYLQQHFRNSPKCRQVLWITGRSARRLGPLPCLPLQGGHRD